MKNEQLKHIFDNSTCLTRRQIVDYISGSMIVEECHAAEHHINSCPFCSEAIEGIAIRPKEAIIALSELNVDFLKEHFNMLNPQVHLNSLAPVAHTPTYTYEPKLKSQNKKGKAVLITTSTALIILLILGVTWYLGLTWYYRSNQIINNKNNVIVPSQQPSNNDNNNDNSQKVHPFIMPHSKKQPAIK